MQSLPLDSTQPQSLESRLLATLESIAPERKLSIAFSGGLDSRFLSFFALRNGFEVELLHASGIHVSRVETEEARAWGASQHLRFKEIPFNPLEIESIRRNDPMRCYACKFALFNRLLRCASFRLCDGTNHSDLSQYRPGLRALRELGIQSPLAAAEFSKSDIRTCGERIGLDRFDQIARPCMLTRFPYDNALNPQEVQAVCVAEAYVEDFLKKRLGRDLQFRLRKLPFTTHVRYELHFARRDFNLLNPPLINELQRLLAQVSELFSDTPVKGMEKLSGFFDRCSSSKTKQTDTLR